MKISQMVKRENFYLINERTLEKYFLQYINRNFTISTKKATKHSDLYVFPNLNAIISKRTSPEIKNYLFTEYSVKGSIIRRMMVKLYLILCFKFPVLFSQFGINIDGSVDSLNFNDILVYPCNRKIRIFNFKTNTVDVIVKDGFSNESILNEIKVRSTVNEDFILPIINSTDNLYREKIIDGTPLARITSEKDYKRYLENTLECMRMLESSTRQDVHIVLYVNRLQKEIKSKLENNKLKSKIPTDVVDNVLKKLLENCLEYDGVISISLSHGDLQHGNVWIENNTEKIYIIDWESAKYRSVWYDRFLLMNGARMDDNIFHLMQESNINDFYKFDDIHQISSRKSLASLIALEDIDYRINETIDLPKDYGISELKTYFNSLLMFIGK
ncbi:hypothetical protein CYL18_06125 [Pradoshia eiseniae]|uniref:Aminoglycoside phosphotransferase domain-containing protein n=1 Tax=Pradoshia eiseniae TaxID=2064768 RepID=A0A2S7N2G5_9BACI|nr:phosphotransferase [Pradoshia eiseniae]PQD96175.1 hypothetical protein CYL18_06125 [Pradoshia eiseniae]